MTDILEKLPISVRYHYARLKYQYKKMPLIKEGSELNGNIEFELYAFFEICYHLKDWFKLDDKYDRNHVEEFINNSVALRISADICNRMKHGKLTTYRSENLGHFNLHLHIKSGTSSNKYTSALTSATIETQRGIECCYALADECMQEWERYVELYF